MGRPADLQGAAGRQGQGVPALPDAAQDGRRPRDRGDVRRPAGDHAPRPRPRRRALVEDDGRRSSPSTTSAATTPSWSSSRGSARSTSRSWPRSSPTPGPPGRRRRSSSVPRPMADPRGRRRPSGRRRRPQPTVDAPRARRSTCSRRSGSTTPTPTWCCPHVLRKHGLSGRDAAFATELASGTIRRQGTYDAVLAACVDRPLAKVEAKVLDALRLGAHQLLAMRVPDARRDLHHRRPGPRRGRPGPGRVRQRGAAQGLRARPRRLGAPGRARPGADPLGFASRRALATRAGSSTALGRGASGPRDELDALLAADNEPPAGHAGRPARPRRPARSCRGGSRTPLLAVRRGARRRRPGRGPGRGRGPRRRAGRGLPAGRAGPGRGAARGPRRALARPLRRPGRQGRPAGRAGGRARRAAASPTSGSRTGPRWCARDAARGAAGVAGVVAADGTRPPWAPGTFDRVLVDAPCSGLGRAAPPARVALAAHARRRRRAGPAAAGAARRRARLACGPAAWSSTRPARRCSPRPRDVVAAVLGDRADVELEDARAALRRACRDCDRPAARARSSSGRTGTAPTRCSWPCCAGSEL